MAKKLLLVTGVLFVSFLLWAGPGLIFSGSLNRLAGYTGFMGTNSFTRTSDVELTVGFEGKSLWAFCLNVGADYEEEIKSFTTFSSLANSFSLKGGLGFELSKENFALDVCAGLKVTDMALDKHNKYALIFLDVDTQLFYFKSESCELGLSALLSASFNGCGGNLSLGIGNVFRYRVDFRSRK